MKFSSASSPYASCVPGSTGSIVVSGDWRLSEEKSSQFRFRLWLVVQSRFFTARQPNVCQQ